MRARGVCPESQGARVCRGMHEAAAVQCWVYEVDDARILVLALAAIGGAVTGYGARGMQQSTALGWLEATGGQLRANGKHLRGPAAANIPNVLPGEHPIRYPVSRGVHHADSPRNPGALVIKVRARIGCLGNGGWPRHCLARTRMHKHGVCLYSVCVCSNPNRTTRTGGKRVVVFACLKPRLTSSPEQAGPFRYHAWFIAVGYLCGLDRRHFFLLFVHAFGFGTSNADTCGLITGTSSETMPCSRSDSTAGGVGWDAVCGERVKKNAPHSCDCTAASQQPPTLLAVSLAMYK